MDLFNDFIQLAGLVDIQLKNRLFTWSNKRAHPSFSKLDRVFATPDWQLHYPIMTLEALEMIVSDHVPIVLSCKNNAPAPKVFKLETFWFKYEMPKQMVNLLWTEINANPQQCIQGFHSKTKLLHRALSLWHKENFNKMEAKLTCCKDAVLFFDRIEERRHLKQHEFRMRGKIKEKAYELANNIEERWRQRSRCNWLKEGDKNTKFFHACASLRRGRNNIHSIIHESHTTSDPNQIKEAFLNQLKSLLGSSNNTLPFNPSVLYRTEPSLADLELPFTVEEVEYAVKGLAANKASGPDGIPNEFLKLYWADLKEEIMTIVEGFHQNSIKLADINRANVIMIPKIESPTLVSDFRPISVINIVPKLLSKILANRLRRWLPTLISPNQTAFIHQRQITENFVATREILHHISKAKKPAVFVKIDFAKAFDTIEWEFLFKVLEARGFPLRWMGWIREILSSASSRVVINGDTSDYFPHKRGLRQGDPLSPMLFNLAADVFQQMVKAVNRSLTNPLTRKLKDSIMALQYADDTAVIASANVTSLISLKLILRLFASISGLKVNYNKSTCITINVQEEHETWIQALLGCRMSKFPTNYLGLPLTLKKPTRNLFLPLIEKIEQKLGGWKCRLISRGGRLQLVQSVLSSVPIYHMMCFRLPQWVIRRIDKVRRQFLWGKSEENARGMSLINWPTACTPKPLGGLGISNLNLSNVSLLVRWLWKAYKEPLCLWSSTIFTIQRKKNREQLPIFWLKAGSFFWKQLQDLSYLFSLCTSWRIGDGKHISYWMDSWGGLPKILDHNLEVSEPLISLKEAWEKRNGEYSFDDGLREINLTFGSDEIRWNLEASANYTAKSIYRLISSGGKINWSYGTIWTSKVPPTVKIFAYMVLQGKVLTRDVLRRRGILVERDCVVCRNCPFESLAHLLFLCPYAVEVWFHVASILGKQFMKPALNVPEIWEASWDLAKTVHKMEKKEWLVGFICTAWHIWKNRNAIIFRGERIQPLHVANRSIQDMRNWIKLC